MDYNVEEIQKQVFLLRPALAQIVKQHGRSSLKDYVQKQWEITGQPPDETFTDILLAELRTLYGERLARAAAGQLAKKPLVSTIEHHGIWNHPIFVNSSLIYSLAFAAGDLAVALATESVSLNNTSSWTGSLLRRGETGQLKRHSFFPDRQKTLPVFSAPAISLGDVARFQKANPGFGELVEALDISGAVGPKNFSAQACRLTLNFWQAVFPSAPKLLYVPLETLVLKYLLTIFQEPKEFLSRLVLTQPGRRLWREYFGAEHTFLFWAIDPKGRRQAISRLPTAPEELFKLMRRRRVYPSGPLCFGALLRAGLVCAGGFNQTTWLAAVKHKLIKLLDRLPGGNEADSAAIALVPTKNFAESSLAWLNFKGKYLAPAAADLYFSGRDYYPKYLRLAEKLTLGQSLSLALPTIYSVVVPKAEQAAGDLSAVERLVFKDLAMADLLKAAGLDNSTLT